MSWGPKPTDLNREGMSLAEWEAAAAIEPGAESQYLWSRGIDPTEVRGTSRRYGVAIVLRCSLSDKGVALDRMARKDRHVVHSSTGEVYRYHTAEFAESMGRLCYGDPVVGGLQVWEVDDSEGGAS